MQIRKELRLLTLFLAIAYGAVVEAQLSGSPSGQSPTRSPSGQVPQAVGTATNTTPTTTNSLPVDARNPVSGNNPTFDQTGQVTTVNPMDPVTDSQSINDSQPLIIQRQNRTMAPNTASGTFQTYPTF